MSIVKDIEIISAPSILGLKPTGVEDLGDVLLACGLHENLGSTHPFVYVRTLNDLYSDKRDPKDNCLNSKSIRDFSLTLGKAVSRTIYKKRFPFVLGGDCSIVIGIMQALKSRGEFGLIFLDAHADFYEPEQSLTGEVADMDLAIVTGRGPESLKNINHLQPYVKDENVIHVGQRDEEEALNYGSPDIRKTAIKCFSLADIEKSSMNHTIGRIMEHINKMGVEGFWIHFDTDVLSDDLNPAVDYRIPGGLQFEQIETLIRSLLLTGRMAGISVTIFNPRLDKSGSVSQHLTESIGRAFNLLLD